MRKEVIYTEYGNIVLPVPENYVDVFRLIQTDKFRMKGRYITNVEVFRSLLNGDVLSWFRMCQIHSLLSPVFNRIYWHVSRKRMIDIPISTKIGCGFYIGHGMCIVLHDSTIIGNNINISQFSNFGSNNDKAAVICDYAYIAPMVCTVEDVTIGFNSVVGAGAVVNSNVPSYKTFAGVPAKEISNNHVKIGKFVDVNTLFE